MKMEQGVLNELVANYVPAHYQPGFVAPGQTQPYITNIEILTNERFLQHVRRLRPDVFTETGTRLRALNINWGILRRQAQVENWEDTLDSHCIFISDTIPGGKTQLQVILLHEIGHTDFRVGRALDNGWTHQEEEYYCDLYAHTHLQKKYNLAIATALLDAFGAAGGWESRRKRRG